MTVGTVGKDSMKEGSYNFVNPFSKTNFDGPK